MSRNPTGSAVLGIASLLLSLVAAELFLRGLYPAPFYGYRHLPPQQALFQHDPLLGWRGRPHASGAFGGSDFLVQVTHDAFGHRSSASPFVAGRRNVVVLGDSFAWGWGVEDAEIFPEQMMRLRSGINVYNLAAPGYGTDQQMLALAGFFGAHHEARPKQVVLQFYWNDWIGNVSDESSGYPKPRFELVGERLRLVGVPVPATRLPEFAAPRRLERIQTTPLNRLHLYNLLFERRHALPAPDDAALELLRDAEADAQNRITLRLMRAIAERAASRGARLLVVRLFPDGTPRWETLASGLDAAGIPFVDFGRRRGLGRTRLWLDGHLSPRGHARLAAQVLDALDAL